MSGNAPTQYYARPTVVAVFDEESSNPGLVVKGRRLTLGEMRRWEAMREVLDSDPADELRVKTENQLFALFFVGVSRLAGPPVREWNMIEDETDGAPGLPVPLPDEETIEDWDQATLIEIMNAFVSMSRARRVSRPLPRPSGDTPSSVEESMRTEVR